jgi:hypothetical protein
MWLNDLFKRWLGAGVRSHFPGTSALRRPVLRLRLEPLEDRTVPSNVTAASVSDLITDINAANLAGGSNTITLVPGATFTLTVVDNGTDGATGLPVIAANDDLTILGNGDVIERSTARATPAFRLFDVAAGASLRLDHMTLQGGLAFAPAVADGQFLWPPSIRYGGALFSQGALSLVGVTVQKNTARGADGAYWNFGGIAASDGAGGGIYSTGILTLEGCLIQNNLAVGGRGLPGSFVSIGGEGGPTAGGPGGYGLGGGVYVGGGTVTISNSTFSANSARGGDGGDGSSCGSGGGDGGNSLGGALYVSAATVSLHNTTITGNYANGGAGGKGTRSRLGYGRSPDGTDGQGIGGGIYVDATASLGLDAFTVDHFRRNHAFTSDDDIFGSYVLIL